MKKILMIIGHDGFRDEEYFEPKAVFENAGYEITTCSKQNPAISKIERRPVEVDVLWSDLFHDDTDASKDFDALVFVGGPGTETYLHDKNAHKLAWDFYNSGKLVTAICWAPAILANAGLLVGKKATVWPGAKEDLCNGNCIYQENGITVDGRIITASGPEEAEEFARKIVEKLAR